MFEQAFTQIDDLLRKEPGCATELDTIEQTSWLLFLKYLDDWERNRADEAERQGEKYGYILDPPYRWQSWAASGTGGGRRNHSMALTGHDLQDFITQKLFPYLRSFKEKASGPNTIEYKIGELFGEIKNRISIGSNLREIIDQIDSLHFRSPVEKHELSQLYEAKIRNMGCTERGGEYYTPRPLIRAIVEVVQPKLGERIYDGAVGSAGFLCEAYEYLKRSYPTRTTTQDRILQERTFIGKEKVPLAYIIAIMNMILHGIESPNILHADTLSENPADVEEKDRVGIVLTDLPFGGKESAEVQENFSIRTEEPAFLFLQHLIKMLRAGGRAGVVIKSAFLTSTDDASVNLRKLLLESCDLHTVLDCPEGAFPGAGMKAVALFFEKGTPTKKIWFYQCEPGRDFDRTSPLSDEDLAEFVTLQKSCAHSARSWSVEAESIDRTTFELSVKNPNGDGDFTHRSPQEILDEIAALDAESAKLLGEIRGIL
jgi:type I restriction enzyme M protein